MIGAGDGTHRAPPLQQGRHPVAADVGQGADHPIAVAQHDDGLACDGHGQIIAGVWQGLGPPGAQPVGAENMLLLQRQKLRRGIDHLWHGAGLFERGGHVGAQRIKGGPGVQVLHSIPPWIAGAGVAGVLSVRPALVRCMVLTRFSPECHPNPPLAKGIVRPGIEKSTRGHNTRSPAARTVLGASASVKSAILSPLVSPCSTPVATV